MNRWQQVSRFRATASITGAIWAQKGQPGRLDDVLLDGETTDQWLRIGPFPRPGTWATWEPYCQTVETTEGVLVAERRDPAASFAGLTRQSPWDDFQLAYFVSEAIWNNLVAPFVFARPDFATEEIEPWHESGQVWRRLVVTYPETIVAHSRQQTYYLGDHGLLRRIDCAVDLLGGEPAVDYPSRYEEFDGIMGSHAPPGVRPQPGPLGRSRFGVRRHRHPARPLQLAGQPSVSDFAGVPALPISTGTDGTFGIGLTINPTVKPGAYSVSLRCGGGLAASGTLTVVSSSLAATGSRFGTLVDLGAVLLALGVELVVLGRRRPLECQGSSS